MLRRLAPILTVIFSILIDTAILPVVYGGFLTVPLSLIVIILISIQLGRMRGMLYGLISGLLLDISAGTLGMKLFPYVALGFLMGFLLYQPEADAKSTLRNPDFRRVLQRAVWVFLLFALYEVVMLILQYFNTAVFEWIYVRNLALRTLIFTLLTTLLYPLFHRMYLGKAKAAGFGRNMREVKNF